MTQQATGPASTPPKDKKDARIKLIFVAILIGVATVIYWQQRQPPELSANWSRDPAAAIKDGQDKGRPVVLFFMTDPANEATVRMIKDSLDTPQVARTLAAYNYCYAVAKVGRDLQSPLARKYEITALPAVVVISPTGTVVDKKMGVFIGHAEVSTMLEKVKGL